MDDGGPMKTFAVVFTLIVIGFFGQTLWLTVLNLAGMPGAFIGWPSRWMARTRTILGIVLAVLGQSYLYLAYVALVVAATKYYIHQAGLSPIFVWPASFFACVFPIYLCAAAAMAEFSSGSMVQATAVVIGQFLAAIGFFMFAFFPNVIAMGWPWTPWLS
jgi:hypothetical protein